jgi:hypothetical protein
MMMKKKKKEEADSLQSRTLLARFGAQAIPN